MAVPTWSHGAPGKSDQVIGSFYAVSARANRNPVSIDATKTYKDTHHAAPHVRKAPGQYLPIYAGAAIAAVYFAFGRFKYF